jgi:oxygen-dependent protoporphyrinogen oxidase
LPDSLASQLGEAVKLNTPVTKLTQTSDGWRVTTGGGDTEFGTVVYCGTAYRLAELEIYDGRAALPRGLEIEAARQRRPTTAFSEIRYPPVASVVLGFRREDVAHPCQGFGMLIPKVEGFHILGTIFSSSLFPNRAPAGHVTLTSYLGGERQPDLALRSPEELVTLACEDLRVLLGIKGRPVFQYTALYPRAIPQYNLGYGRYREWMDAIENQTTGLFLAGHYREGVSLGDSIVSGCNVVERVEKFLTSK